MFLIYVWQYTFSVYVSNIRNVTYVKLIQYIFVHIFVTLHNFMKSLVQVFNSTAQHILELLTIIPILVTPIFKNRK